MLIGARLWPDILRDLRHLGLEDAAQRIEMAMESPLVDLRYRVAILAEIIDEPVVQVALAVTTPPAPAFPAWVDDDYDPEGDNGDVL